MLDDDNSDRYTDADDLVPAMNSAIDYLTAVFSSAFEQKKIQPEVLSELTDVFIYNPTVNGGTAIINLNDQDRTANDVVFNDVVWTIFGVDPTPTVSGADPNVLSDSLKRFACRLTLEEWNYALEDPFAPGYSSVPTDFARVAFTGPGNYFGDGGPYLLLRPGASFSDDAARVGVWLLKKHTTIADSNTEVLFPVSLHELIVQKILYYISYQHGSPKYAQTTDKEVKELIALMNL